MEDSIKLGEDFLAHYGVPGMHWGIRNEEAANYTKEKLHKGLGGHTVPYNQAIVGSAIVGAGVATAIATGAIIPIGTVGLLSAGFIGSTVAAQIIAGMGQRKIYRMSDARTQWIRNNNPNAPELLTRA